MKRFIIIGAFLIVFVAGFVAVSGARTFAANPGTQGQPSQSCQAFFGTGTPLVPNGFNTNGFATAAANYAGSQQQNSNNPHSVSQYDVACFQHSTH